MVTIIYRLIRSLMVPWFAVNSFYLTQRAKAEVSRCIAASEGGSRLEVQVVVEGSLPMLDILRGKTPKQRAAEVFCLKKTWDTKQRSGMLLYFNVADKAIEIIADRGIPETDIDIPSVIAAGLKTGSLRSDQIKPTHHKIVRLACGMLAYLGECARRSPSLALAEGEIDENELED